MNKKSIITWVSILLGIVYLTSCKHVNNFKEESSVENTNSPLLNMLIRRTDFNYEINWVYDKTSQVSSFQLQSFTIEYAERYLEGKIRVQKSDVLLLIRQEIYRYSPKNAQSINFELLLNENRYIGNAPLKSQINFDGLDITSYSECASYKKFKYQDCVVMMQYPNITSVIWINSSVQIDSAVVHQILDPVLKEINNLISTNLYIIN